MYALCHGYASNYHIVLIWPIVTYKKAKCACFIYMQKQNNEIHVWYADAVHNTVVMFMAVWW